MIRGCSCRRESPGASACTEGWGTCLQMTFWDTSQFKDSYIWITFHACNYNNALRVWTFEVKYKLLNILLSIIRGTPAQPPFSNPLPTNPRFSLSALNGNSETIRALSFFPHICSHLRVYSTFSKSTLSLLLLHSLSKSLFNLPRTWSTHNQEVVRHPPFLFSLR
jgi:hypothetical protein